MEFCRVTFTKARDNHFVIHWLNDTKTYITVTSGISPAREKVLWAINDYCTDIHNNERDRVSILGELSKKLVEHGPIADGLDFVLTCEDVKRMRRSVRLRKAVK